jgi:hypothetical protein
MTKNILGSMALLFCMLGIMLGCENKPCREIQAEEMAQKNAQNPGAVTAPVTAEQAQAAAAGQLKVKVYKPDGSLQCGMGSKIALETMEKDLKGIKVFSRTNMNDGLMRIQVCGAPTGQSNVYEIARADLEKALKAGFKEWTQE